jgi:hypothetical protein
MHTDNGSQFKSVEMATFCNEHGIQQIFGVPHYAASQGLAERRHLDLKRALHAYTGRDRTLWANFLQRVQFDINTAINRSIKMDPHTALFAYQANAPFLHRASPPALDADQKAIRERLDSVIELRAAMEHNLVIAQSEMKQYYDSSRRIVEYQLGEIVLIRQPAEYLGSLDYAWTGPYAVYEKEHQNRYWVRHLYREEERRVHVSDMKRYHVTRVDPDVEVHFMAKDNREWVVEAVEDWGIDDDDDAKTPMFLVRWAGYDDPDWQPVENMLGNEQFERFLRDHKDADVAVKQWLKYHHRK